MPRPEEDVQCARCSGFHFETTLRGSESKATSCRAGGQPSPCRPPAALHHPVPWRNHSPKPRVQVSFPFTGGHRRGRLRCRECKQSRFAMRTLTFCLFQSLLSELARSAKWLSWRPTASLSPLATSSLKWIRLRSGACCRRRCL